MSSNDSRKITQSPLATGAGSTPLAHAENKPSINLIIMLKISNQTCSSMKSNVLSNYKKKLLRIFKLNFWITNTLFVMLLIVSWNKS